MLGLALMVRRFTAAVRISWRDQAFRGASLSLCTLLISATIFYSIVEGWSVLDSVYFAFMTGLTIGYGDFAPEQPIAKVFTIFYALLAVGLFVALATSLANSLLKRKAHKRNPTTHRRKDAGQGDQTPT